jgi:single-strand DNA-binding protein
MSANVSILGNLGRAPEMRVNAEGVSVANFSIASNSVRNTPQGAVKKTDWFKVTAIGKQAETLARYARKGSRLYVQGKLTFNPWLDREGAPQVSADLLLQDFQFVGGATPESETSKQPATEAAEHSVETEIAAVSGDVQEIADQTLSY